jgi:hypothetical protein
MINPLHKEDTEFHKDKQYSLASDKSLLTTKHNFPYENDLHFSPPDNCRYRHVA